MIVASRRCGGWLLLLYLLLLCLCGHASAAAMEPVEQAICRLIEQSAGANRLPVAFVTRIIWRESAFHAGAVSPAGAMGIAQFMPGTALERGLADPFDPEQAIPKAARLLADLRRQFGNLGIAAAAYNAGAARVAGWLRGESDLPAETRAYVRFVTERGADEWAGKMRDALSDPVPAEAPSCVGLLAELRRDSEEAGSADFAPLAPWGVQLAGNFSKARALAAFERARSRYARLIADDRPMIMGRLLRSRGTRRFYQVRLPAASRAAAVNLCARIQASGGNCVPLRS
ncbi:MAG TPA: lytic transglycosylase domain-containing protein [Stellaceae bacterium]|jgi:hypothetical protein|nr:lytic transglycosylase domain-containing protein [Stellaceae bacterium]